MTRHLPPAAPGSLALLAGVVSGLRAVYCPASSATLLLALGLALRGRAGQVVAFLGLGLLCGVTSEVTRWSPRPDRPVVMALEVRSAWQDREDGLRAVARGIWIRRGLAVSRWNQPLKVVLPRGSSLPESARLRVKGYLRRPVPPANGVAVRPASWVLRSKSSVFITPLDPEGASPLGWVATGVRGSIDQRLLELEQRDRRQAAMLVRVLVLGQTDSLPGSVLRSLRASGLAHLVALSGLHVGLLVGAGWVALSSTRTRVRTPLALALAWGYVLLAGARPSLLRATLMIMAMMIFWLLRRPPRAGNVLCWVAAAMVVSEPTMITDLGFQLTMAATGGILLLSRPFERHWSLLPEILLKPLSVSVAAQLAVLPWTLSAFHLATPLSPIWNLLAMPWAAVALVTAFAWVVVAPAFPPLGDLLEIALGLIASPMIVLGGLPPEVLGSRPVDFDWWRALVLTLALTLSLLSDGRVRWVAILAVVGVLLLDPEPATSDPELVLLDVGQGEAILLRDGDEALLIDGGGWRKADIAQRVLLPALTRIGVHRLSGMVLSHTDLDHCGGLLVLSSYMSVGRLFTSAGWPTPSCATELLTRPGLQIRALWRGEAFELGRWHIRTLHPKAGSRTGRNNRSLVLLAETMGKRVLLTGDLEVGGEREILAGGEIPTPARVDVLKIGHHGSDTSTSSGWLDRLAPRIALISSGVANRYGHPHPRVVERLEQRKVRILRTDQLGMISIAFGPDGKIRFRFPGQPR